MALIPAFMKITLSRLMASSSLELRWASVNMKHMTSIQSLSAQPLPPVSVRMDMAQTVLPLQASGHRLQTVVVTSRATIIQSLNGGKIFFQILPPLASNFRTNFPPLIKISRISASDVAIATSTAAFQRSTRSSSNPLPAPPSPFLLHYQCPLSAKRGHRCPATRRCDCAGASATFWSRPTSSTPLLAVSLSRLSLI